MPTHSEPSVANANGPHTSTKKTPSTETSTTVRTEWLRDFLSREGLVVKKSGDAGNTSFEESRSDHSRIASMRFDKTGPVIDRVGIRRHVLLSALAILMTGSGISLCLYLSFDRPGLRPLRQRVEHSGLSTASLGYKDRTDEPSSVATPLVLGRQQSGKAQASNSMTAMQIPPASIVADNAKLRSSGFLGLSQSLRDPDLAILSQSNPVFPPQPAPSTPAWLSRLPLEGSLVLDKRRVKQATKSAAIPLLPKLVGSEQGARSSGPVVERSGLTPETPKSASLASQGLPVGAAIHLNVVYSPDGRGSAGLASALSAKLESQLSQVVSSTMEQGRVTDSAVAYFFPTDQGSAELVAENLTRLTSRTEPILLVHLQPPPKPGTIEIRLSLPDGKDLHDEDF
jgi:hypothetical protein